MAVSPLPTLIVHDILAINKSFGVCVEPGQAGKEAVVVPPAPSVLDSTILTAAFIIVSVPEQR